MLPQMDNRDCGVACLASIVKFFGRDISFSYIRTISDTDSSGTSLFGLTKAAVSLGFDVEAIKAKDDCIDNSICLPAIAHIISDTNYHFILILEIKVDFVIVGDP